MAEMDTLWTTLSLRLRETVSDAAWRTWFESVEPVGLNGATMVLRTPSSVVTERLRSKFLPVLVSLLQEQVGDRASIEFQVSPSQKSHDPDGGQAVTAKSRRGSKGQAHIAPDSLFDSPGSVSTRRRESTETSSTFDTRYTFDAFVIGSSNRFAHAAALSVAEQPSRSYNPLFIHGGAGLGKTHLLHAIGNYLQENYPTYYVKYVSTETFLNEFIDAIRRNTTTSFKRRYRECDVLLIDDIQFLEKKESFQEEFFHTFNSLYGGRKQLVFTSDRPPSAIATLEDRLRSRFMSGLTTDVQPPDIETRVAILRKKAEDSRCYLPPEVAEFIATRVRSNIRELEGALTRVSAFARLNKEPISKSLAEEVLHDLIDSSEDADFFNPHSILKITADFFKHSVEDLLGSSRKQPLAEGRQIAMYVVRELTELSYPAIGKEFGGRDHTTVMHAVSKIEMLMQDNREIYQKVTDLLHLVKNAAN